MALREMRATGHEQVTYFSDAATDLPAIVAIHDTTLGPALGGTRILDYPSEEEALADALRLSKAMTYKAAAADLDLGGGKAVIVGDPKTVKTESMLLAYGRAVDGLCGHYVTTEDMNTEVEDMDVVARETDYVVGTSAGLGDPSPVTAAGVVHGIRACLERRYGDDSLPGVEVLVQGVGKVGRRLTERLVEAGASVTIADPDETARSRVREAVEDDVDVVDAADALTEPCDVLAPCAAGYLGFGDPASLREAIPELRCDVVAGSANNALGDHEEALDHARSLARQDVLYAPDYVINAGGLILTDHDRRGSDREAAFRDAERIGSRLSSMFERADLEGITTLEAANRYAEDRFL